jgi:fructan beta-fructosidase
MSPIARGLILFVVTLSSLLAQSRTIHITQQYLNVPIARTAEMRIFHIDVNGVSKREFAMQLADTSIDYWIFIDVTEFKGQTITLSGPAQASSLDRIYQAYTIEGATSLYREANRPQFHFTVKRGWNNDVNGPIFYKGQYHLFWQAFAFGVKWDTDFMYWGHAVSQDLLHWRELPAALINDRLGSPWSGTSLIDHNNDAGFGKDALVLVYTAFDRATHKQVQCLAFSTDNSAHFSHYDGNPILDSNSTVGSHDTRDPKVFWYEPTKHWVMVLFEKDGMSFYNSTDLKSWTHKSHFPGLHECPDFFELPVDGDPNHKKWILHGGSSSYFIGAFDGETFTPESPKLRYAEGKNLHGDDTLYAAESFVEMPDGRRVQMAWGRIESQGMPFNQVILFPTEFHLKSTKDGLRLRATPIEELTRLRGKAQANPELSIEDLNRKLNSAGPGPLDVNLQLALKPEEKLTIKYNGVPLATIEAADLDNNTGPVEVLIDNSVAEIFVNQGTRYIVSELHAAAGAALQFATETPNSTVSQLYIYPMKSIWHQH